MEMDNVYTGDVSPSSCHLSLLFLSVGHCFVMTKWTVRMAVMRICVTQGMIPTELPSAIQDCAGWHHNNILSFPIFTTAGYQNVFAPSLGKKFPEICLERKYPR